MLIENEIEIVLPIITTSLVNFFMAVNEAPLLVGFYFILLTLFPGGLLT